MIKLIGKLFLIISSTFLLSCAIQVAPQGGEKDTKPPKILKSMPENFSTGFDSKKILITFDEYIQLKDLNSQLIVSPPLSRNLETKIRQKTLVILVNDTLQPNTTYTMNFGNAIVDNNESNALDDFQYVFSTGGVIDSLKISGSVENTWDKKTEKGVLVMLYKKQDDSLPLKKKPDYFSKTNEKGIFSISNVAPASYKIFALKETNADYLFNVPDESIAFSDTPITAGYKNILLHLFTEKPKQRLLKSFSEEPGKAVVIFSQPGQDLHYRFVRDSIKSDLAFVEQSKNKDTLVFWYKNLNLDSLVLFFSDGKAIRDTVSIRLFKGEGKTFSRRKSILSINTNFKSGEAFNLNNDLFLQFNHPVTKSDFSKISLMEDSVPVSGLTIAFDDTLKKRISIHHAWKEKALCRLFIPPGVFTDIFGLSNDTVLTFFKIRPIADFGNLVLKLKPAYPGVQYVVMLIDDNETIYRTSVIKSDTTLTYDFLDPKIYRLKAFEDINHNRTWDTGDYFKKIQPEKIFYYPEMISVRANWDVDVSWKIGVGN